MSTAIHPKYDDLCTAITLGDLDYARALWKECDTPKYPWNKATEEALYGSALSAARSGHTQMCVWLAQLPHDIAPCNNMLSRAIGAGQTQTVQALLALGHTSVDFDVHLRAAVFEGYANIHIVDALMASARRQKHRLTDPEVMVFAARFNRQDLLEMMLADGADIHADNDAALRAAAAQNHLSIVRWLLALGADARSYHSEVLRIASVDRNEELFDLVWNVSDPKDALAWMKKTEAMPADTRMIEERFAVAQEREHLQEAVAQALDADALTKRTLTNRRGADKSSTAKHKPSKI